MEKSQIKFIYTSDIHGQLLGTSYATKKKGPFGLSRLQTYLKSLSNDYVLIDNGDILQGSFLLDYHRLFHHDMDHPVATVMNHMAYGYMTVGNHDFNFGFKHLLSFQKQLKAKILCCNIVDQENTMLFEPYAIHTTKHGIRVGIIGAVTPYIPMWEKPEHIQGLTFLPAYENIMKVVGMIKNQVDLMVVLYHGGFENDMKTGKPIGRPTTENEGFQIAQIKDIHVLCTGHQHVPQIHQKDDNKIVLQTGFMASDFAEIDVLLIKNESHWTIHAIQGHIKPMHYDEDSEIVNLLEPLETAAQSWLDETIGYTAIDMTAHHPMDLRANKHPLVQLIANLQKEKSGAEVAIVSLPNEAPGFPKAIRLRDLAANFIYPNIFYKMRVTGKIMRDALERTAEYYTVEDGVLKPDNSFLFPKEEHYNVDIYDGIDYVIDATKPKGSRVVKLTFQGHSVADDQSLTIVLNNYRAVGGGDYPMFQSADVMKEYDITLFDLVYDHIKKHPFLDVLVQKNFHILTK